MPEELWRYVGRPSKKRQIGEKFTIGYFGLMAYRNSWEIIKKIVAENSHINFYLRGHNYLGKYFKEDLKYTKNIEYSGMYSNPEDLEEMFSKIDISWAINSENYRSNTNDEWAMCNRFYEGLYFKKPLIVQDGSAHSDFVKKNDIGICIDARNYDKATESISKITSEDIARWNTNIEKIEKSIFVLELNEYAKIIEAL